MKIESGLWRAQPRRLVASGILGAAAVLALLATASRSVSATSSYQVLYAFCSSPNCADGSAPRAGVVRDSEGNLYGTTSSGGTNFDYGTVFEVTPDGKEHVLHSFCTGCADGTGPVSDLVLDTAGNLFGTARTGGAKDSGTVFELTPNAKHTKWKFKILYTFCQLYRCADGAGPGSGLTYWGAESGALYDGSSPLYGVTGNGGTGDNGGTIYEIDLGRSGAKEKVIHSFCSLPGCSDGQGPSARLTVANSGDLFGTTLYGGNNGGIAFQFTPARKHSVFVVLYTFCSDAGCTDGEIPYSPLAIDAEGNLLGTVSGGGLYGGGAVFKIVPRGEHSRESIIYNFCSLENCADGWGPLGDIAIDANGDIVGAAGGGAHNHSGVIFKLHGSKESVLYDFCAQSDCADGEYPVGGVILDNAGNIYGTAEFNTSDFTGGIVFELIP
jgi:uncharacterized repeat protein (TIGR03803 family)